MSAQETADQKQSCEPFFHFYLISRSFDQSIIITGSGRCPNYFYRVEPQARCCIGADGLNKVAEHLSQSTSMNPKNDGATKSQWDRREFLKVSAATTLGLALSRLPVMAGPFTREDFDRLVPADKKLSPEWVASLFERGTPEVLRGSELRYVGMPIGGIGAGQLYLGGDGRLWHWDIFNKPISTGSEHYAKPLNPASPLRQQFSLTVGEATRALDSAGFSEVAFRGEYPIGIVEYADPGVPVTVKMEVFSPFIPLNTEDSSLPATIFHFTL